MNPKDDLPEDAEPELPLPPELAFAAELPHFEDMDADEIRAWTETYFSFLRKNAAHLQEYGYDVEATVAYLEPELRGLEEDQRKMDKALDEYYNLQADMAEASYKAFKRFEKRVAKALEKNPFCPQAQKAKMILEEWRKQVPKE